MVRTIKRANADDRCKVVSPRDPFSAADLESTPAKFTRWSRSAWWVAQEFRGRCGDKHEYFSETPDLALVKAVIAHAARLAESEDIVAAVFDVRRAYFHAEEKKGHLC